LSELRAHSRQFDWLIDESGTHRERRRSQRDALVSAADFDQFAGPARSPAKTAASADEPTCLAFLSLSDFSLKTMVNSTLPSHRGRVGLPVNRENNPSPVASAAASLNRTRIVA
jgi:hypothetical protein